MNPEDVLRELRDPDRWKNVRVPRAAGRATLLTRVPPARLVQLVAAYAIAILFAVGLLVGLQSLRHATPPAATPSTSPTSVTPPRFAVVPGATHVYSAESLPSGCTLAQLQTESKQDGGGAAGTYIQAVAVRNTGADCLLAADAVRVGGEIASQASVTGLRGLVIPTRASALLTVETAEACQPSDTANIDPSKLVLPISLRIGDATRTMAARFPRSRCSQPRTDAYVDLSVSDRFASPLPKLEANVDPPASTPAGLLRYTVALQNAGPKALVLTSCPSATEVLNGPDGTTVSRTLTLHCTIGATLEPDVPVTISVPTVIPAAKGYWTISWFLSGGSGTAAVSSTCTLAQLHVAEPGPAGGATGSWVQLVEVRNQGADCTLPVTAFAIGGMVARAGSAKDAGGFHLTAGSTTRIAVAAATTCADGTLNIKAANGLSGQNAKPVALQLGGHDADGLDQLFPLLYCAGPYVNRVN